MLICSGSTNGGHGLKINSYPAPADKKTPPIEGDNSMAPTDPENRSERLDARKGRAVVLPLTIGSLPAHAIRRVAAESKIRVPLSVSFQVVDPSAPLGYWPAETSSS